MDGFLLLFILFACSLFRGQSLLHRVENRCVLPVAGILGRDT